MKILIIGGTLFLGRRLVEAALARGHQVTTFTRGRHNPGIHTEVEALRGDRNSDVSALNGRRWDAVIDTCGYVPVGVTRVIDAIGRERSLTTRSSRAYRCTPSIRGPAATNTRRSRR